jgi:hypothetical protein
MSGWLAGWLAWDKMTGWKGCRFYLMCGLCCGFSFSLSFSSIS